MESHGEPGRIQISPSTKTLLELTQAEGFKIESRGTITVKVSILYFLNCQMALFGLVSKAVLSMFYRVKCL